MASIINNDRNKTAGSGRFQNLQRFMSANQDTSGAMANKIGTSITQPLEQQKEVVGGFRQDYQKQSDEEQGRISQANPLAKQATANPITFQNDKTKLGAFEQLRDGKYKTLEAKDYGDVNKALDLSQQRAEQVTTEQGRFRLLDDVFANPEYTQGAKRLDQLLLQTNVPALQRTGQQVTQGVEGLRGDITSTEDYRNQLQQAIASGALDASQLIDTELTGASQATLGGIDTRLQSALAQQKAFNDFTGGKSNLSYQDFLNQFGGANAFGNLTGAAQSSAQAKSTLDSLLGNSAGNYDSFVDAFRNSPSEGHYSGLEKTGELSQSIQSQSQQAQDVQNIINSSPAIKELYGMQWGGQPYDSVRARQLQDTIASEGKYDASIVDYLNPTNTQTNPNTYTTSQLNSYGNITNDANKYLNKANADTLRQLGLDSDVYQKLIQGSLAGQGDQAAFNVKSYTDALANQAANTKAMSAQDIFNLTKTLASDPSRKTTTQVGDSRQVVDNFLKYVQGPTTATRENIATSAEAERLSALNSLLNKNITGDTIDLDRAQKEQLDRILGNIDFTGLNKASAYNRFV